MNYRALLHLQSKIQDLRPCPIFIIAVNTQMNVLANLRYHNLASCCIIYTEETKHCPELFECISRRVTSFLLTSLSLRIAVTLHALYFRLCWETRRLQDSGLGSAALRADSSFQIISFACYK